MWQNFFAESRLWIKPNTKKKKNIAGVYSPSKIFRESGYGGISMNRYECSVVPQLPVWHAKTPENPTRDPSSFKYTSCKKWMESLESNLTNEEKLNSESVSADTISIVSTDEESDVYVTCADSFNTSLTTLSAKPSGTFTQAQCISCEPTAVETRNTLNEISSNSIYFASEITDYDYKRSSGSKESDDIKESNLEDENSRLQEYSSVQELYSSKDERSLNDCISESRDLTLLRTVSVETDIKLCEAAEWCLSRENRIRLSEYLSKAHSIIYGVCQPPLLRIINENHKSVIDEIQNIRSTVNGLNFTLNQVETIMKNLEKKVDNINFNVTNQHDGFLIGVEAKHLDDFYKHVNCIKEVTGSALNRIQQLEELFGDVSNKEFNLIDKNNIVKLEIEKEKENKKQLFLKECKEGKIHQEIKEIEEIQEYLLQIQHFLEQIALDQF